MIRDRECKYRNKNKTKNKNASMEHPNSSAQSAGTVGNKNPREAVKTDLAE